MRPRSSVHAFLYSSYSPSGQSFAVQTPCTFANSRICSRCVSLSDVSALCRRGSKSRSAAWASRSLSFFGGTSSDWSRRSRAAIGAADAISATAFGTP